jgi:hypothetical protein
MLSTLKISGVLDRVAGVVLGAFTKCEPGEGNYGTLTLDEVFDDYFKPLNVPVYSGALFGHIKRKFTRAAGAAGGDGCADAGALLPQLRLLLPQARVVSLSAGDGELPDFDACWRKPLDFGVFHACLRAWLPPS